MHRKFRGWAAVIVLWPFGCPAASSARESWRQRFAAVDSADTTAVTLAVAFRVSGPERTGTPPPARCLRPGSHPTLAEATTGRCRPACPWRQGARRGTEGSSGQSPVRRQDPVCAPSPVTVRVAHPEHAAGQSKRGAVWDRPRERERCRGVPPGEIPWPSTRWACPRPPRSRRCSGTARICSRQLHESAPTHGWVGNDPPTRRTGRRIDERLGCRWRAARPDAGRTPVSASRGRAS